LAEGDPSTNRSGLPSNYINIRVLSLPPSRQESRGASLPVFAVDLINPAFQHTKHQLFRPFRFGQWVRLAFVGLLAGEMGSGGGCSFNYRFPSTSHPQGLDQSLGSALGLDPAMLAGLITFLVVAGLGLFVLFTYINSVMRFILFDSIIARECQIRKGWNRRRRHGLRLFVWQILLMLAFFASIAALVGLAVALAWRLDWIAHPGEHVLWLALGGCVALLLLFTLILAFAVVHVMTKDFVVPQMALEDISAVEGWRRLWAWLKAEKVGYAGYIGMKIVMAIGAGMAFGMMTLMIFFLLLIPIGGVGLLAVLAGKAAGLTWTFYTIAMAVLAGCVALAIFLFAASFMSVPAVVFFPAYAIYFFAPRYPILAALLWPQPVPSETPFSTPAGPPPSPPAQAPIG
jgi:hypothetical protein